VRRWNGHAGITSEELAAEALTPVELVLAGVQWFVRIRARATIERQPGAIEVCKLVHRSPWQRCAEAAEIAHRSDSQREQYQRDGDAATCLRDHAGGFAFGRPRARKPATSRPHKAAHVGTLIASQGIGAVRSPRTYVRQACCARSPGRAGVITIRVEN